MNTKNQNRKASEPFVCVYTAEATQGLIGSEIVGLDTVQSIIDEEHDPREILAALMQAYIDSDPSGMDKETVLALGAVYFFALGKGNSIVSEKSGKETRAFHCFVILHNRVENNGKVLGKTFFVRGVDDGVLPSDVVEDIINSSIHKDKNELIELNTLQ